MNILIVEDKKIDRSGIMFLLEKLLQNTKYFEASNGIEALGIIENNQIDLIITDIKMPKMDGLTLISKIHEMKKSFRIVIFSAFSEFEYAKLAMKFGVKYYLLKPIKIDEFTNVIKEIEEDIDNEEKSKWAKIIVDYINNRKVTLSNEWHYGNDMVLVSSDTPIFDNPDDNIADTIETALKCSFSVLLNEYQTILFFDNKQLDATQNANIIQEYFINKFHSNPTIVVGGKVEDISNIGKIYGKMDETAETRFFELEKKILSIDDRSIESFKVEDYFNEITEIINFYLKDERHKMEERLDILFKKLKDKPGISPMFARYICVHFIQLLAQYITIENDELNLYTKEANESKNLSALKNLVLSILQNSSANYEKNDVNAKMIIAQVSSIIKTEYMKDLNLENVSERVFLSPSYLSFLFTKIMGMGFIKYLTNYRIEQAKIMLKNTDLKIISICENVGYNNVSYFCLLFKNHTGVTPMQYRENKE
jgi:two-component system response regulator YesN